jgi:hypothetical protein
MKSKKLVSKFRKIQADFLIKNFIKIKIQRKTEIHLNINQEKFAFSPKKLLEMKKISPQ